eukprot:scaffold2955_cov17-Tisochrysis_lutea.AAC.2
MAMQLRMRAPPRPCFAHPGSSSCGNTSWLSCWPGLPHSSASPVAMLLLAVWEPWGAGTRGRVWPGVVEGMLPRTGRRWGEADSAKAQESRGGSLEERECLLSMRGIACQYEAQKEADKKSSRIGTAATACTHFLQGSPFVWSVKASSILYTPETPNANNSACLETLTCLPLPAGCAAGVLLGKLLLVCLDI